uniref:Uncharacterized protein n=1 Tax=Oryza punctata TaxID=4537 RepID=A0A0E0MME7_ORYPU
MDPSAAKPSEEDKALGMDPSGEGFLGDSTLQRRQGTGDGEKDDEDDDDMPSLLEALGEETLANFPQDLIDRLKAYEDGREAEKASFIEIQNHFSGNGMESSTSYAEYKVVVNDDGEDDSKVPSRVVAPPGRRRFRSGVTVKKNQSGGGSH